MLASDSYMPLQTNRSRPAQITMKLAKTINFPKSEDTNLIKQSSIIEGTNSSSIMSNTIKTESVDTKFRKRLDTSKKFNTKEYLHNETPKSVNG